MCLFSTYSSSIVFPNAQFFPFVQFPRCDIFTTHVVAETKLTLFVNALLPHFSKFHNRYSVNPQFGIWYPYDVPTFPMYAFFPMMKLPFEHLRTTHLLRYHLIRITIPFILQPIVKINPACQIFCE